jgi:N-acetylated-alpha-linked acidic dipeptidase
MRLLRTLALFVLASTLGAAPFYPNALDGFAPASVPIERGFENAFLDIPSAQGALDESMRIDERPHDAGSPDDYALALYMRDRMRAFGIDASLESFRTRVDHPKRLLVQLVVPSTVRTRRRPKPAVATLDLAEHGAPVNAAHGDAGTPFNAGSPDGDVTAPLVYVHRGIDADYDQLTDVGVSVKGAIVLVRYGAEFRGALAERAQARGAVGVLFYSDPIDDGRSRGATYPDGPYRPSGAVQRGSVGDDVRIPTLPISADNARTLLAALVPTPVVRQSSKEGTRSTTLSHWTGGLDIAYPYARGPALVHLVVQLDRRMQTLWNTIGRIRGTTQGAQVVVMGAHRDAWVRGVTDNGSGVTTMLEAARAFGYLAHGGWHPKRTIVIAGWDGEEIGLRGSHAYVAAHRDELLRDCVAYINADEDVSGAAFGADAVSALANAVVDATRDVPDPANPHQNVRDRWGLQAVVRAPSGGSDHESFLSAFGTPVADLGFRGDLGTYHSVYDDFFVVRSFIDPNFTLHRAMSQIDGLIAMRIADADVLPFRYGGYVDAMQKQLAAAAATKADVGALQTALSGFAAAAARADAATLAGRSDPSATNETFAQKQAAAARILDAYYYRIDGYRGSVLGALAGASANGNSAALQNAMAEATDTLARATDALTVP